MLREIPRIPLSPGISPKNNVDHKKMNDIILVTILFVCTTAKKNNDILIKFFCSFPSWVSEVASVPRILHFRENVPRKCIS